MKPGAPGDFQKNKIKTGQDLSMTFGALKKHRVNGPLLRCTVASVAAW
jgi:hypothetical protein